MRKAVYKSFICIIYTFLYIPIIMLIINSFNASRSRTTWGGFTLNWYKLLFRNSVILQSLENTIMIALISSLIAALLGTLACVGMIYCKKFVRSTLIHLNNIPMINPEIVMGISYMLFFVMVYKLTGLLKPGLLTLIIAHSAFCAPYVFLSVLPKIRQLTPQISEAAQDLGCTPFQAFYKVLLTQITPGIVTGIMMSFTMSIDDFTISYFTSGNVQTLPLAIYSMTRVSISPEINALSAIFFVTILFLLIVINIMNDNIEWV